MQREVIVLGSAGDQQPGAVVERKIFPRHVGEAVLVLGIGRALEFAMGAGRQVENGNGDFAVNVREARKLRARLEVTGRLKPDP